MRSLGVQLPDGDRRGGRGGAAREIVFFVISFLATFLAALLVIGLLA